MITPHTHSSIQLRAYVMEAPPLGVVPLYTGDLCPSVYVRVSGRVCICKLYIHFRVCTCTPATRYLCVSIPRRGRTRALTMPLAGSVADIGWLMEKFSPQRKLWYTLVSPVPPLAARNRSWSPSLFRVYLMWITPVRATVAWGSSPPAGQGQFETLSAISDEGSNLGGDTVFKSYRFALRIALVLRSSFASPRSCISHRDSRRNKGKFARFAIDDDIGWRVFAVLPLFVLWYSTWNWRFSKSIKKIFVTTNILLKEWHKNDLKIYKTWKLLRY